MTPITSDLFQPLKADVESYPRLCGYYLIKMVDISDLRVANFSEEDVIDTIFQHFDDKQWPAKNQRSKDQQWTDYIVDRDAALTHAVEALVAGPPKGHSRPTIEPNLARLFFDRFDAMFDSPKSYFVRMGFGNPDFTFCDGVAIISQPRAGLLWVVEGD